MTVELLFKQWLEERKCDWKRGTSAKYESIFMKYFYKALTGLDENKISADSFNDIIRNIQESSIGIATQAAILRLLRAFLKALSERIPIFKAIHVQIPRIEKGISCKILNQAQLQRLLKTLSETNDQKSIGVTLAAMTGIRLGELCALKFRDFDFTAGAFRISRTLQRLPAEQLKNGKRTELRVDRPKSSHSERVIPIPNKLLLPLKKLSEDEAVHDDFFFLTSTIKPVDPRTLQKFFKKMLVKAGLPNVKFHALRHTFASLSIAQGAEIKSLSDILGHSSIQTTLDIYVHLSLESKRKLVNIFADVFAEDSFCEFFSDTSDKKYILPPQKLFFE